MLSFGIALLTSIFAGSLIGMERQWRNKLAGMRTTALVCLGATLFVMVSTFVDGETSPTRISAQVVSGIGFLAGGVIIREGFTITGINTAATLWCSAAVGTLIGAGFPYKGLLGAVTITIVNIVLRNLSRKVDTLSETQQTNDTYYHVSIICFSEFEMRIRTRIIQEMNYLHLNFSKLSFVDLVGGQTKVNLIIEGNHVTHLTVKALLEKLSIEEGIVTVELLHEESNEDK